jgi:hypothetical protein
MVRRYTTRTGAKDRQWYSAMVGLSLQTLLKIKCTIFHPKAIDASHTIAVVMVVRVNLGMEMTWMHMLTI